MPSMSNITSLSIGTLAFDGSNYILEEVNGLEFPMVRLPRYNLPGQSGAFISNALYGERAISIRGVINSPTGTRSTYITNRTNLINACSFIRDVNGILTPQTLYITLSNGQSLTCQVYPDKEVKMGFSPDQDGWEEFIVSFIAPDPNLYSSVINNTAISLAIGGGTAIPTRIPISLASASGGTAIISNPGANVAYPVITLIPPLTNPYIANLSTNQFIKLNYDLVAGSANVVIDCNAQTMLQNVTDVSPYRTIDSLYWGIFSGSNTIGFSASAGTGSAQISYYPSYIGV